MSEANGMEKSILTDPSTALGVTISDCLDNVPPKAINFKKGGLYLKTTLLSNAFSF
jgi:hypothetical protein